MIPPPPRLDSSKMLGSGWEGEGGHSAALGFNRDQVEGGVGGL